MQVLTEGLDGYPVSEHERLEQRQQLQQSGRARVEGLVQQAADTALSRMKDRSAIDIFTVLVAILLQQCTCILFNQNIGPVTAATTEWAGQDGGLSIACSRHSRSALDPFLLQQLLCIFDDARLWGLPCKQSPSAHVFAVLTCFRAHVRDKCTYADCVLGFAISLVPCF